jgi:tetratricopeptide (TPR) repeat protein
MNDKMRGYFYDQLGQYYSRKNQWDSVMFYSEKSLTLLPRNTSIWNRLEKSYDTLGALEQNIALYNHREIEFRKKLVESRERTKSGVDEVFIYLSEELGYKYYETKDYNNAILFWEKSFEDGKGSFNTLKDLGSVFLMTKQFENARNAYDLYNQNMNIPTVTDSSTLLLEKLASHLIWLKENGYDSTVIEQEYHKYVIEQK